jgi:predicted ATPase
METTSKTPEAFKVLFESAAPKESNGSGDNNDPSTLLKEVIILDFKSIKKLRLIVKNNITCLIGKNESGKSSIIEAISYLNYFKSFDNNKKLKNKSSKNKDDRPFPAIQGTFEIRPISKFIPRFNIIKKYLDAESIKDLELALSKDNKLKFNLLRWGDGPDNFDVTLFNEDRTLEINLLNRLIDVKSANELIDKFIELFVPAIELFTQEDLAVKPATIEELKSNKRECETLRRVLQIGGCTSLDIFDSDDDEEINILLIKVGDRITKLFNNYYAQDKSIEFFVTFNRGKINISIKDSTEELFSLSERSPGFQYFFAFVINKQFLTEEASKPYIFLLDEPGASLYPHGCRDLLKTFDFFAKNSQIIYTTHNVFLTLRNDLDSLIFTERNKTEGTKIIRNAYKNKFQIFRKELGILLNDSFLIGNINIVVEGETEHFVLRQIISEIVLEDEAYNTLEWLNIYNSDGVCEIENALRYLSNSLGLSGTVLLDSDAAADKVFNKPNVKILLDKPNWNAIRVNEIFDNDNSTRTFEDLFPKDLYLRAYNSHYGSSQFEFDSPFVSIPEETIIQTPIVERIKEHYQNLFTGEHRKDNSFSKVNVMRVLLESLNTISKEEKKEKLKNVYRLIELIKTKINSLKNVTH